MTIVIAARLIERGALALEDPLSKFVPDFPNGDAITVDHLLNHRAGIPHRVTTAIEETVPTTAAEMTARAAAAEPLFAPGETSVYSSGGYSVLARVLEVASGKTYAELIQQELCEPAELEHTVHATSLELVPNRAQSYVLAKNGLRNTPLKDFSFLVGAGSVYSTAGDLFRMTRAALNGDYGASAKMAITRGGSNVSTNGATSGFRAFIDFDASTELTVVFTGNVPTGVNDRIRALLPQILEGEEPVLPPPPTIKSVELSDAELARYVGDYTMRESRDLGVTVSDGMLLIGDWLLIPTGKDTFFSAQDYAVVRGVVDDEGRVTGLEWSGDVMEKR